MFGAFIYLFLRGGGGGGGGRGGGTFMGALIREMSEKRCYTVMTDNKPGVFKAPKKGSL